MTALVSVGLPVFNGEPYLRAAIESILAQEYRTLELIISDNASTDRTEAICREYVARDARVRYVRAGVNRGAVQNFASVLELARGEYFMWAAYDDLRHPAYVDRCVAELAARPDAVLCCTSVAFVDEKGRPDDDPDLPRGIRPAGKTPVARVRQIARANFWYDFYGLMRMDVLRDTRGPLPVWGFDVVLTVEMCMRGSVIAVEEPLFIYRVFRSKGQQDLAAGLAPARRTIPVSWSEMAAEMICGIWTSPGGATVRARSTMRVLVDFCMINRAASQEILRDAWTSAGRALRRSEPSRALALVGIWAFAAAGLPAPRYWKYAWRQIASRVAGGSPAATSEAARKSFS